MAQDSFVANMHQAGLLVKHFCEQWEGKHGKPPVLNAYKDKMNLVDVIQHIGHVRARKAMDYMLKVKPAASMQWYLSHYDKLLQAAELQEQDEERLRKLREQTKKRMEG